MPNQKDHRSRAAHNHKFLETIPDEFADWLAIVAFYEAVHLVEMVFATLKRSHNRTHGERNKRLKREYPHIWRAFYPLWNYSKLARYECTSINVQHVRYKLIAVDLQRVRDLAETECSQRRSARP